MKNRPRWWITAGTRGGSEDNAQRHRSPAMASNDATSFLLALPPPHVAKETIVYFLLTRSLTRYTERIYQFLTSSQKLTHRGLKWRAVKQRAPVPRVINDSLAWRTGVVRWICVSKILRRELFFQGIFKLIVSIFLNNIRSINAEFSDDDNFFSRKIWIDNKT